VRERLAQFQAMGMRRIVALRGDLPSGFGGSAGLGEFRHASDLVAFIRAETGDHFHIEVAAYPEMHPQAKGPQADLQAYAAKVQAGASSAITQFFFNSDAYFRFVDEAHALGADVPVVPGIMPITNSAGIIRFADGCGAEVPRWLRLRLQAYGDDLASIRAFGLDVVTDLCDQLRCAGVPGLHFYTMNQSATVLEIARRLDLAPAA
jgi:methylenetetrahydrofolate reductase (NADPH)